MRRPDRLLPRPRRRLRRALLAVVVALAGGGAALALATGSTPSDRAAKRSPRPAVTSPTAEASALLASIAAGERTAARDQRPRRRPARRRPRRSRSAYYRRTTHRRVPSGVGTAFLPLYREAARSYGVNWRLIASIHRQETAFSTVSSTYQGLNSFGCCAGPMQFNVTNGPVSTWKRYRQAFRDGRRPKRYPHRTSFHPSIYDDFDAIMAAGSLLSDSGAGSSLDGGAWWGAYSYYGHDLFGVTYATQVLSRAVMWQRNGFCVNCGDDAGLVARYEAAYGARVRRQLIAAERRRKQRKQRKNDKSKRERRDADRSDDPAPRRPTTDEKRPSTTPTPTPTTTSPPTPTQTTPAPAATAPAPPAGECSSVHKLLGC